MQEDNKKAMVIEDDTLLADFYTEFIAREFDIETIVCRSGAEVERYAETNGIDDILFFICDLNIPVGKNIDASKLDVFQGFELIENILPPCKVIIASGYISPEITQQARRLGVVSLYQKPPNLSTLAILINFLLNC